MATPEIKPADAQNNATQKMGKLAGGLKDKLNGLFGKKSKSNIGAPKQGTVEVVKSVLSHDASTRKGSVIYVLSVIGLIVTGILSLKAIMGIMTNKDLFEQKETEQALNLNKFFREQKETAFSKEVTLILGAFTFEVIMPADAAPRRGMLNMAEIEITVECETIPTCRFLEGNAQKARDQIFSQFTTIEQKDVLSAEGKRRIKDQIKGKLNEWLASINKGKVKRIYFTRLLLN